MRRVWWAAVAFDLQRSAICCAVEVSSAFIYEQEFKWDTNRIGMIVGGAFLFGWPLVTLANIVRKYVGDPSIACGLTVLSAVSSWLLWPGIGKATLGALFSGVLGSDVVPIVLSEII